MESACCFIGHRNIERASEVQEKLRKELRKLIEQGTTRFIFGDHSEFNTLCYDTVTELMQEYPQIKRVKFRKDYPEITESVKQWQMSLLSCDFSKLKRECLFLKIAFLLLSS